MADEWRCGRCGGPISLDVPIEQHVCAPVQGDELEHALEQFAAYSGRDYRQKKGEPK